MNKTLTIIGLAAATLAGITGANAQSAFTVGNLVIYRVGNGTSTLNSTAWNIDLLEVTTGGSIAQTINVPTTGGSRLTASGTATSEGKLRSNGQYLAITGYDAAVGTSSVVSGTDARRALVYGNNGTIATTLTFTSGSGAPYAGNNIRGAIPNSSGNAVWTVGTASSNNGTYYLTDSSQTQLVAGNLRTVEIFGNQLYVSTAAGSNTRVMTVGTGLPTTSGQSFGALTGLPTSGSNYGSFQLFDLDTTVTGFDTLYLSNGNNIEKYSLVSGTWTLNNSVNAGAAIMDFTAAWNGSSVNIFAVTATDLFSLNDATGYNANISSSFSSSLLAAGNNYAFRGIDFAPIPEPATWLLLGAGLTALVVFRRRRQA